MSFTQKMHGTTENKSDPAVIPGSRRVFANWFMHMHPVEVPAEVVRPKYAVGLGLITLYLFLILAATGILLMFYYIPTTRGAYDSINDLTYVVSFGKLVRNMHRWAAHAMVISVFLHMCRVFFIAAYKEPRQSLWETGVFLFILTLFSSFTGYLLPWDQLAYWAVTIGSTIAGYTPIFGQNIKEMILGGQAITQSTLTRFYVLHVILMPLLLLLLTAVHLWKIHKAGGLCKPPVTPERSGGGADKLVEAWQGIIPMRFAGFIGLLVLLLIFSFFFDAPLESLINPAKPPNPAKAAWYFLGLQELVSHSALIGGVVVPLCTVTGLLLVPYIDRKKKGVGVFFSKERPLANLFFLIFALVMVGLIIVGYLRGPDWIFYWPWQEWSGH